MLVAPMMVLGMNHRDLHHVLPCHQLLQHANRMHVPIAFAACWQWQAGANLLAEEWVPCVAWPCMAQRQHSVHKRISAAACKSKSVPAALRTHGLQHSMRSPLSPAKH
jgi:hypothetical protein